MRGNQGKYRVNAPVGSIRTSCFLNFDEGWEQPTGDEVRQLIKRLDMPGSQVAKFVGSNSGRNVRKWQSGEVNIQYSAWRLLAERYARVRCDRDPEVDISQFGRRWEVN